jgi:hypothetical protein
MQAVQDISNALPGNLPMVLIKPPEACSTAEVYKVINECLFWNGNACVSLTSFMYCRGSSWKLEQASRADPLTLLENVTQNGISQDIRVNDLGMHVSMSRNKPFGPSIAWLITLISVVHVFLPQSLLLLKCCHHLRGWRQLAREITELFLCQGGMEDYLY